MAASGYGGICGTLLLVGLRLLSCSCEPAGASWWSAAAEGRVERRDADDGVRLWRPARSAFRLSTPDADSARPGPP